MTTPEKHLTDEVLREARRQFARSGALALRDSMTPAQRKKAAQKAAKARWAKRKKTKLLT